ncbi:MAG: SAM-dependent chlorinase/fluorinase [Deltaproteobacteria bacterium]|nr:SAM-dependent chlorinase/fluorinase [Deltaproteobacteria bacterium]
MSHRIITFLTDFGARDAFVGIMKGVVLGIHPTVALVDLSHEVPPQNILTGALILRSAVPYFPPGTIHVAVIDPGVGSSRRALAVETRQAYFVGPDNGVLSLAAPAHDIVRTIHLTNEQYFLPQRSQTFHGRDVFAPVAAHLARGIDLAQLGSEVPTMTRLSLPPVIWQADGLAGCIIHIDHFGNAITNMTEAELRPFPRETLLASIGTVRIRGMVSSYASVEVGAPTLLVNSWGLVEIAIRNGSAAQRFGLQLGQQIFLTTH